MALDNGPLVSAEDAQPPLRRISLAREYPFSLGPLAVDPGTRRIAHPDGREEFLEPRVMQVLVALAQARGAILSRDDLIERCWAGRIVGEDALTRVISRLRRLSDTLGQGVFTIETLTKVGYRLILEGAGETGLRLPTENGTRLDRRAFMVAGAAAGVTAFAAGGALLYSRLQAPAATPETELLLALAWQAWAQGTSEGNSQAIGLYRRAVESAPENADAWGFLGYAYGDRSHAWARAAEREPLRERARAAGQRALALDPKNAYGRGAIAYARPLMGNWLLIERECLRALADQPDKWLVTFCLGLSYIRVGRFTDAAARLAQVQDVAPTANQFLFHAQSLWGAGRLDEAERLMDEAVGIYSTNPTIWSAHFNLLLFSGRPRAAIALAQNADSRPATLSDTDIEEMVAVARAMESRDPASVSAAVAGQTRRARESARSASYAIQVASALGRVDDAFRLADAYYFSRGFVVPDARVPTGRAPDVTLNERYTGFLFMPSTRAMRADRRFARLVSDIGLERYWQQADALPDYRGATSA